MTEAQIKAQLELQRTKRREEREAIKQARLERNNERIDTPLNIAVKATRQALQESNALVREQIRQEQEARRHKIREERAERRERNFKMRKENELRLEEASRKLKKRDEEEEEKRKGSGKHGKPGKHPKNDTDQHVDNNNGENDANDANTDANAVHTIDDTEATQNEDGVADTSESTVDNEVAVDEVPQELSEDQKQMNQAVFDLFNKLQGFEKNEDTPVFLGGPDLQCPDQVSIGNTIIVCSFYMEGASVPTKVNETQRAYYKKLYHNEPIAFVRIAMKFTKNNKIFKVMQNKITSELKSMVERYTSTKLYEPYVVSQILRVGNSE